MAKVAVFGGAAPVPGEPSYEEAYLLGKALAAAGHSVINGGYIGTMEAVSRGAAEAGGIVIGVTCDEIEKYRPSGPNPWVQHEIRTQQLRQRILAMIDLSEAAIALPGGVGTFTEILTTWNHLLIGAITPRPLIVIGAEWRKTIETFFEAFDTYISPAQRAWILFANDPHSAVQMLEK
jgi:uncharacterized protein (TIGR00730 family)